MPPKIANPRAHLNTGEKPPTTTRSKAPGPQPDPKPLPAPTPHHEPSRGSSDESGKQPQSDRRLPAGTKLEPDEMDKLDRIARWVGRTDVNRSAALRWLVQDFDETRMQ